MGETGDEVCLLLGDGHVSAPPGEVIDGHPEYLFSRFHGLVLVKLDMHCAGHHGLGRSSYELGVVALGDVRQRFHYALDIHHHGVHGAGNQGQLLLHKVTRQRYAVTHQYLVGRAAHAGQVDAAGTLLLG